ncbi:restriction endonuclease [Candidatus Saccharibacteria bacterium]|nr:restriction endonuclease [Candidatus Saccharibacteria bacterium]
MAKMFMVRSGEGNYLFEQNREKNVITIGWNKLEDLTNVKKFDDIKKMMIESYPDSKPQTAAMNAGQVNRFVNLIHSSDYIITYCSEQRIYLVGKDKGEYKYDKSLTDYYHSRKVEWIDSVKRDDLTAKTKNALGSIATVFEISEDAKKEILYVLEHKDSLSANKEKIAPETDNAEELKYEISELEQNSRERIKDKFIHFSWEDMQNLVAAILRAMGFKTKISKKGSDRGKDIVASPDGLGLENPRIFVEVKHRDGSMGAPEIRSFIGGLREGCKGIYVSTGGFTKEARYEAERSIIPLTLVDSDDLVDLIVEYYDNFDTEGRSLIPLKKIYWPM